MGMVGNNTPVFFVRDRMKFQHFIRAQKRRADTGLRDHDMRWDFWSLLPESAHQVTWLMGDRGGSWTSRCHAQAARRPAPGHARGRWRRLG